MKTTRSLACANTLIVSGALVAAVIIGVPLSPYDGHHWIPYPVGLIFAAPALTLAGTVWSGWLARRESQPRGLGSWALFTLGIVLSMVESLWILLVLLGIGANS